jgi:hypothetical protein
MYSSAQWHTVFTDLGMLQDINKESVIRLASDIEKDFMLSERSESKRTEPADDIEVCTVT